MTKEFCFAIVFAVGFAAQFQPQPQIPNLFQSPNQMPNPFQNQPQIPNQNQIPNAYQNLMYRNQNQNQPQVPPYAYYNNYNLENNYAYNYNSDNTGGYPFVGDQSNYYSEHLTANNYSGWPAAATQYGGHNHNHFHVGDRPILSPNIGNYNVDPTTTAGFGLAGPASTPILGQNGNYPPTLGQNGNFPPGYFLSTGGSLPPQESTAPTTSTNPQVLTTLGPVTGKLMQTPTGNRYRAFLAIPYADFQGRFKKPAQATAWEGVFDATEYRQRCVYQARNMTKEGERCHFIKILAPENSLQLYPVIFWPHGGGFSAGANDDYNNDALVDILVSKGVIIAQPNYRVGAFGFWSLGTKEAPGNYAMWDVLEALKWVNREIKAFSGDPSRIICHGQGAGSVVCDLLSMSPKAHGLLSALSMWSGQIFSPKIDRDDVKNLADFATFATAVGCDDLKHSLWNSPTNRTKILTCMEKKSLQEIIGGMSKVGHGVAGFWHPRPDGDFWPESLEALAKKRPRNIPVMTGTTRDEWTWDIVISPLIFTSVNGPPLLNDSLNDPELVRRQCEELITSANFEAVDAIRHACVEKFLKQADPTVVYDPHFWIHQAAQVGSGFMYHGPCLKNAHYFQKTGSPVYLFSFDHELDNGNAFYQAARSFHNLDLLFLENFLADIFNHTFSAKDQYVRNLVGDLLTNFAKYGMPTPRMDVGVYWQQLHRPKGYNYLSISYPAQMMSYFNVDSTKFWIDSVPLIENAFKATAAARAPNNKLKTG